MKVIKKKKYILPLSQVPLKLLVDTQPLSHCSKVMLDAVDACEVLVSRLTVRRIIVAISKASTMIAMNPPANNRRQFRRLFFVISSWNIKNKNSFFNFTHSGLILFFFFFLYRFLMSKSWWVYWIFEGGNKIQFILHFPQYRKTFFIAISAIGIFDLIIYFLFFTLFRCHWLTSCFWL